jgi:hypothetical protein
MNMAARLCGVICLFAACWSVKVLMDTPAILAPRFSLGLNLQLTMQFVVAIVVFFLPGNLKKQRTALLAERDAAPAEAKSEYEEATAPPDLVFIGVMTGVLSLFAVPVVFGPAAIICGVMAMGQGHPKGLVAIALGIIGIVFWVPVFSWIFRSGGPRL